MLLLLALKKTRVSWSKRRRHFQTISSWFPRTLQPTSTFTVAVCHILLHFNFQCPVSSLLHRGFTHLSLCTCTHTQQLMVQLREHQKRCELLQEQEEEMRKQLSLYSEKFEEFQETLSKSNSVFATFKKEMDKVRSLPA